MLRGLPDFERRDSLIPLAERERLRPPAGIYAGGFERGANLGLGPAQAGSQGIA